MDQTASQIEHHIHNQREDLNRNLRDLENKVKVATSWQFQFENHRGAFLGAAFAGGLLLAVLMGRPSNGGNTSSRACIQV